MFNVTRKRVRSNLATSKDPETIEAQTRRKQSLRAHILENVNTNTIDPEKLLGKNKAHLICIVRRLTFLFPWVFTKFVKIPQKIEKRTDTHGFGDLSISCILVKTIN